MSWAKELGIEKKYTMLMKFLVRLFVAYMCKKAGLNYRLLQESLWALIGISLA
jgi:hypothetical protein